MAEAAEKPSHAQMIREMQAAKFQPTSHDQMVKEMQAANYQPPPPEGAAEPGFMDRNINPLSGIPIIGGEDVTPNQIIKGTINDLPLVGGVIGGALGGGVGTGLLGPGAGTAIVGSLGAGYGAEAGSYAKDALNNLIYGKQTSLVEAHKNAIEAQNNMATGNLLGEGAFQALGQAGKAALATSLGAKAGELVSGVPASLIKAYSDGAQRIKAAFSSADESTFRMAQAARAQYGQDIAATRRSLNDVIAKGIEDSSAVVHAEPIIENLKASAAKLNPKLDGAQIDEIQQLIAKVREVSFADGTIPVQSAQQLKVHFQDLADSAYAIPGTSNVATPVANAAKGAAAITRKVMEPVVPKEVAAANKQLSTLHTIEDNMSKALLNPRKSAAPIIAAGTGESAAGAKNFADLQDMQAITGTNMTGAAEDVAAASALGKYKPYPSIKGLGQPAVKAAIDATNAMINGGGVGPTLGQSVMHGTAAVNSLDQAGPTP